jgi:hypothetical protein
VRELWIPSPHYSTSRGAYLKGAYHTTEGAQKIRDLGAWFQNPSAGCSSHHGSDNYERGLFGAYVYENHKAWTQGNGNPVCLSLEQCTPSGAASSWSRDTWLSKTILIDNAAEWMNYMAGKYGLPYKWLTNSEAQDTWTKGFCEHVNGGSAWSGHHDCGSGFPNDVVMDKARAWGSSGGSAPSPTTEEDVSASSVIYDGDLHMACVWKDGRVNYAGPDGKWYAVDPVSANKARSGAHITVNNNSGLLIITYTNTDGKVCTWQKKVTDDKSKWGWYDRKGDAK